MSATDQYSFFNDVYTYSTHSRIPCLILATVMHVIIIKAPTTKPWPHASTMTSSVVAVALQSFVVRATWLLGATAAIEWVAKTGIALLLAKPKSVDVESVEDVGAALQT